MATSIILVGVEGFGQWHLSNNVRRLVKDGLITLTALVDPIVKARKEKDPTSPIPDDAPLYASIKEAVGSVGVPSLFIIATPIHVHAKLAIEALEAGGDVYLEKPPFATLADYNDVLALAKRLGRAVQVGFQSIGSLAIPALAKDDLGIGRIKAVRAMGFWLRPRSYWHRAPWVGKRHMGDTWVMDGVTTNALAHAVQTALRIAGISEAAQVEEVEVEMYRANPIDCDDTTSLRVTGKSGKPVVTAGITLCAKEQLLPLIEVAGETGTATFYYTEDKVDVETATGSRTIDFGRVNLLEDLIDHRKSGRPLLSSLESTGAFMRVMDAARTSREPIHIERKWVEVLGEGDASHPVIKDVEDWIKRAGREDSLFSEIKAPWSFTKKDTSLATGKIGDTAILQVLDGKGTSSTSSPRPFIHPVNTLNGTCLTAVHPSDHDWHLGLGFTIPDVNGYSFWGGGTFIKGRGYVVLDNHGTMDVEDIAEISDSGWQGLAQTIVWRDPAHNSLAQENRIMKWREMRVSVGPGSTRLSGWQMRFETTLSALDVELSIGSPGTNGRENAGYGGFFWRLPRGRDVKIMSDSAEGEDAVHGSVGKWMAWSGRFDGQPGLNGNATIIIRPVDATTAKDPWIVRQTAYPGIGSAFAWKERVIISAGQSTTRKFAVGIFDGLLDRVGCEAVADLLAKV